jgi:uncharacterized RmlC-like cupin family protein
MSLPSALEFLSAAEKQRVTFVKPALGKELRDPFAGSEPAPRVLAARSLTMQPWTAVPMHVHEEKEKIYVALGVLTPALVLAQGVCGCFESVEIKLVTGKPVCVPAGVPHFVKHTCTNAPCTVMVISSSQDAQDIAWEANADQLVEKKPT